MQFLSRDHHSKRPMNLPGILFLLFECRGFGGGPALKDFHSMEIVQSTTLLINLWSSCFSPRLDSKWH